MHKLLMAFILACAVVACGTSQSDYDKICAIYRDYESVPDTDTMAMIQLSARVEKEAPDVNQVYTAVVRNPPETRYSMLVENARRKQPRWQCETIKKRWPPVPVK
jgi:hypothetical protein